MQHAAEQVPLPMRAGHGGTALLRRAACAALGLLAAACGPRDDPGFAGSLEWDRIAVTAEVSEPLLRIAVHEGEQVAAGTLLAELDDTRVRARLQLAGAQANAAERRLEELRNGTRPEVLDAARARVARARAAADDAAREAARVRALWDKRLVAESARDGAEALRLQSQAQLAQAQAELSELVAGTRSEQVARAEAERDAALAAQAEAQLAVDRLRLVAPRDGRVDAIPYKAGDRPPAGGTVVSLLVGERPYARVFVPAPARAGLHEGQSFTVQVSGIATPFSAHLRTVASEPAFTPYYALTGDDASRLAFRAELVLDADAARALPAGLPLQAAPAP